MIPSTLLAQVDASIGGKTGINSSKGKNLIGSFYQPKLVITELGFLKSLSKRNLVCGFAEILKHSLIYDKNFFNWINKNSKNILEKLNLEILKLAIVKSCKIKSHFILMDEKEKNERMILNFGHTFAHGIEAASNFSRKINHGEAVLIGIILATRLSFRKKLCSFSTLNKIEDFYNVNSLPSKLDKNFLKKNSNKIVKYMVNDKKNTGDRISLILLKKIGKTSNPGQVKITIGEMKKILKNIN
ncbi:MAG: 3-dehydroquinate synthase [Pelagibacteraceae bacterium]|nr:3-dehydroquinate synthase [Pelagibacteraceae bacterium]